MEPAWLERYLSQLAGELRARSAYEPRIVVEVRDHLLDAFEQARRLGLTPERAARRACERFGSAESLAAQFAAERGSGVMGHAFGIVAATAALLLFAATGLFLRHRSSEAASPHAADAEFRRLRARFADQRPCSTWESGGPRRTRARRGPPRACAPSTP